MANLGGCEMPILFDQDKNRKRGDKCYEKAVEMIGEHPVCWTHATAIKDGMRSVTEVKK